MIQRMGIFGVAILVVMNGCGEDTVTHYEQEEDSYCGIMTIAEPCLIEYCGPKYKLWNEDFTEYIPLMGEVQRSYRGMLIRVHGDRIPIPEEERDLPPGAEIPDAIEVERSQSISNFDYNSLGIGIREYMIERYGCSTGWDKSFGWYCSADTSEMWIRLTDTYSEDLPFPFIEVHYDCETGLPVREVNNLDGRNPCDG